MRPAPDQHPLYHECRLWKLAGGPLMAATLVSGVACGVLAIVIAPRVIAGSEAWLLIPASIPVAFGLATRRSIVAGLLGGLLAALTAYLILVAYLLWKVACFVITFMGEC